MVQYVEADPAMKRLLETERMSSKDVVELVAV